MKSHWKGVIGSTQYYTTRLNRGGNAQRKWKKLPYDSKNWCRAKNGGKVLNWQNSVDWVARCSHVSDLIDVPELMNNGKEIDVQV